MAEIQLIRLGISFQPSDGPRLLERLSARLFAGRRNRPGRREQSERDQRAGFQMERIYLTIPDGKTMVILGPNGCGKTTLLRIIAGLIEPDEGEVRFDGQSMTGVPTQDRRIGMVFQSYALYPHFTSKENILSYFVFREQSPELDEMARRKFERTSELLGVDIEYLLDRRPGRLSAGEQQRVALGRCITRDPAVMLLDEPFANLDSKLRNRYRLNLKRLLTDYGVTAVHVTHDQQEARLLADRLAIMDIGSIEQVGTYQQIYQQPANLFVADFLNLESDTPAINWLSGDIVGQDLAGFRLGIRPEDLSFAEQPGELQFEAEVEHVHLDPLAEVSQVAALADEEEIVFKVPAEPRLAPGDRICLQARRAHIFDRETGKRERTIELAD